MITKNIKGKKNTEYTIHNKIFILVQKSYLCQWEEGMLKLTIGQKSEIQKFNNE